MERTPRYMKALEKAKKSIWEIIPETDAKFMQFMESANKSRIEAITLLHEKYNEGADVKRYVDRVIYFARERQST